MRLKVWFPVIQAGSGTDVFTRRLAAALERRGIDTEITWFPTRFQFAPFLLGSAAAPRGIGVVHANSWNGFAFKRPQVRLAVTEHLNVLDHAYRPYKSLAQHLSHELLIRRFVTASFREASAVTAVSRYTALSLARALNVTSAQVIPNWIDTGLFSPVERDPGGARRRFRLLFVGNLSRRKGADLLAPIMKQLGPTFELGYTTGLRGSRRFPVQDNMIPLGRVTDDRDLVELYRRCDALLFPSRFEGFGYAALEAMACGKPVVATNASSLPEVVGDGIGGILCPPDDVGAFIAACRKLAANPDLTRQYGEAGRRRAEELFSEDLILPRYIALYQRLADGMGGEKQD